MIDYQTSTRRMQPMRAKYTKQRLMHRINDWVHNSRIVDYLLGACVVALYFATLYGIRLHEENAAMVEAKARQAEIASRYKCQRITVKGNGGPEMETVNCVRAIHD